MEAIQFFVNLFSNQDFLFKITLTTLLGFYGLFALIVAIQINNLNKVLNQIGFSSIFNILAAIHLITALALLIFAVLSL